MATKIKRLSPRAVQTANEPGLKADGGGLYLQIGKSGARSWIFRFTRGGRAREMGLGPLHTVSLAEAREKAEACRKLLDKGMDPIEARDAERRRQELETARSMTFKACAEEYVKAHKPGWRNEKHASQWENTLKTYVYPIFGDLPVQAVDTALVMKVLEPIWSTKTETASRVRGRIEAVLDWASVRRFREGENPARWKGHLDKLLPQRTKVCKVVHHAALPYPEIGAFMEVLRQHDSVSARGLEFQILTATRTGEVIGARWSEFDLDKKTWTIPGDRTKTGREHRVPLSTAALSVLRKMASLRQSEYIFPGSRPRKPVSNMAFLQLLKRMGRPDLTAHGFRSTFRDWAAETTAYPRDVAEMALGHAVGDKVEAAYRRGDLFDKRVRMMEDWARHCGRGPAEVGTVVPIRSRGRRNARSAN